MSVIVARHPDVADCAWAPVAGNAGLARLRVEHLILTNGHSLEGWVFTVEES